MKAKIIIAGYGYVGRAVHSVLIDAKIVDPKYNKNTISQWWNKPDGVIICVNTPTVQGVCQMQNVIDVIKTVPRRVPILIKSTISLQGWSTIRTMFANKPITFSPEFLTAANPLEDFKNQGMMYIGGGATKFWRAVFTPHFTVTIEDPRELIIAKLFRNAFLATKVTFFNQVYDYCEEHKLDYNTVNSLVAVDKRIGHSHTGVPGNDGLQGFGGRCLPKDCEALLNTDPDTLSVLAEIMRYNRGIRKDLKLLREEGKI